MEKSDKPDMFNITLEGLARIRLPRSLPPVLSILPPNPLPITPFSLPLPTNPPSTTNELLPFAFRLLPKQLHERLGLIPPSLLADLLITVLGLPWETRAELLGVPDVEERSSKVKQVLQGFMAKRGISPPESIPSKALVVRNNLVQRQQRETPAQPQATEDLQPLHQLLSQRDEELSNAARHAIKRELGRLGSIPPQSAEYSLVRNYVEWLLSLPWKKVSEVDEEINLDEARRRLDAEHEGLEAVKRRVVEYLAVYRSVSRCFGTCGITLIPRLKKQLFLEGAQAKVQKEEIKQSDDNVIDDGTATDLLELIPDEDRREALKPKEEITDDEPSKDVFRDKGPILLLVGPPGVGKTSIARSLADSLGRQFHRISLGGVRDEAEIRGHRRTYVGALPGLLVQALRKVKVANPLILLDELDKVGTSSFHGDPSAALLETLDPAQNWGFHDHYLGDVTVDLSQVLFIATANSLDTISPPLLDRCEVIECSGYVTDEKMAIAKRFLLPKQIKENGLGRDLVKIQDEAVLKVITDYTREVSGTCSISS